MNDRSVPETSDTSSVIAGLFRAKGDSEYGGEAVTQQEHALQCAALAEQDGASPSLIVAALLHDVGHLLHELPSDAPDKGIDDRHEVSGNRFLQQHFDDAVTEPVRLHVAAKRYLCTVDPDYRTTLSQPSLTSLELQGGNMSDDELADFRQSPHWEAALRLRRWDDAAKVAGLVTPRLQHFLMIVEQVGRA